MEQFQTIVFLIFILAIAPVLYAKISGESPSLLRKVISAFLVIIFVSIFSFIYHMLTSKSFIESFSTAYEKAQYYKIAETPNSMEFGCSAKEQLETIDKLAAEDNIEKFKTYFLKQVEDGNCIVFNETEEIKLIESEVFSDYVLVERKESKKHYWTAFSTLREK
jgi:hypothetical protein